MPDLPVLGIDIGSVSVSCVLLDEAGDVVATAHRPHQGKVRETLAAVVEELAPGTVAVGEPSVVDYAMATDPAEPVVRQLEEAVRHAGRPAAIRGVNYGTDASKLARAGIPAVVFGPGSIRQAHSADEWIELRQVEEAATILATTIRAFA